MNKEECLTGQQKTYYFLLILGVLHNIRMEGHGITVKRKDENLNSEIGKLALLQFGAELTGFGVGSSVKR